MIAKSKETSPPRRQCCSTHSLGFPHPPGREPTVEIRGDGKGGRCCELAVRVSLAAAKPMAALFGSSDGVDGNSGVAGFRVSLPVQFDRAAAERELARSNSLAVAASIGTPLPMRPSGNNLRDLYLLARS